jgi:hypothetical protein
MRWGTGTREQPSLCLYSEALPDGPRGSWTLKFRHKTNTRTWPPKSPHTLLPKATAKGLLLRRLGVTVVLRLLEQGLERLLHGAQRVRHHRPVLQLPRRHSSGQP